MDRCAGMPTAKQAGITPGEHSRAIPSGQGMRDRVHRHTTLENNPTAYAVDREATGPDKTSTLIALNHTALSPVVRSTPSSVLRVRADCSSQ